MKFPRDLTDWQERGDGLWARRIPRKGHKSGEWKLYYERICGTCGEEFLAEKPSADRNPDWGKYCSYRCVPHASGEAAHGWKGGWRKNQGYIYVLEPGHPNADKKGYVAASRLVASGMYGRAIGENEVVHHMNGDRADNRQFNLVILTKGEHNAVHKRKNHQLNPPRD